MATEFAGPAVPLVAASEPRDPATARFRSQVPSQSLSTQRPQGDLQVNASLPFGHADGCAVSHSGSNTRETNNNNAFFIMTSD